MVRGAQSRWPEELDPEGTAASRRLDGLPRLPHTSLARDLEFLDDFLAIMKARFQDRLAVRLEIAPEAREVLVPHLLLQPLVENSIRHCMDDLSRTGEITISASREGERLRLGVQDSGPAPIPHHPTVVFVSTYDEYAVSAFEVEAVDYMLKPFTESRFHQASQRVRETLDRLESRLDPERFARIHRSTIVSIGHVRELRPQLHGDYEVVLIDGTSIRLGRPYRERLIKDHDGA